VAGVAGVKTTWPTGRAVSRDGRNPGCQGPSTGSASSALDAALPGTDCCVEAGVDGDSKDGRPEGMKTSWVGLRADAAVWRPSGVPSRGKGDELEDGVGWVDRGEGAAEDAREPEAGKFKLVCESYCSRSVKFDLETWSCECE